MKERRIEIDHHIKNPPKEVKGRPLKFPFSVMEVGDYFYYDVDTEKETITRARNRVYKAVAQWIKYNQSKKRFKGKTMDSKQRVKIIRVK